MLHRQLTPVWRGRTRHGRVWSLDAPLGDGLSLRDLVATDVDLLAHMASGVYEDERLNRVLRGLAEAERQVVVEYAARKGTTRTEAASAAGAAKPKAFGDRVRRKVNRLVAEQCRRAAQRRPAPPGHLERLAGPLESGRGEAFPLHCETPAPAPPPRRPRTLPDAGPHLPGRSGLSCSAAAGLDGGAVIHGRA
ncbi:hypothetical protein ACIQVK_18595 [Streptomyces sp. NPDC090493]|uniref:hypothetical protein n=1 Tax=Streptomyces sp. NPDC090493 TaxID=3365964 RepID=UPI0038084469